jgi:dihydroorotase
VDVRVLTDLKIIGARIYTPSALQEGCVAIEEGKIFKIGKEPSMPPADLTIDIKGKLLLPGLIDVHVHLRGLELSYKENFTTGTAAAAAGGFTTVLDMPNTRPPTNSSKRWTEKMEDAKSKVLVNTGFYSSLPEDSTDYPKLRNLGMPAFKIHLYKPSSNIDVDDRNVLLGAFKNAATIDKPVAVHAEERKMIEGLQAKLQAEGRMKPADFSAAHPPEAEEKSVERVLEITQQALSRTHFCHVSTYRSLASIREAKRFLRVTCETTPQHLLLTNETIERLGGIAITDPPPRILDDNKGLMEAFLRGEVDIIGSDHAPHALEEKMRENVWDIPPGFPGLETTVPLLLTKVSDGTIPLNRLVESLTSKPAEIFRLEGKGRIEKGYDADLTVVDLKERFIIDPEKFRTKAKYSPFSGWRVTGRPITTIVGGRVVYEAGEVVAKPGIGALVKVS